MIGAMRKLLGLFLFAVLVAGCMPDPNSDPELESRIEQMVDAQEIVTVENFGMLSINILTTDDFNLSIESQLELAERIAQEAVDIDPDRDNVAVFFTTSSVGMQMSAFMFENEDGALRLVHE